MRPTLFVTAFALAAITTPAAAYRPFETDDATPTGARVVETEYGWVYADGPDDAETHTLTVRPIYGLTEQLEVFATLPFVRDDRAGRAAESGFGDAQAGVKFVLVEPRVRQPGFALRAAVKSRTGDDGDGLGTGDEDFSFLAASTLEAWNRVWHANIGAVNVGDDKDAGLKNVFVYGIGVEQPFSPRAGLALEIFGTSSPRENRESHPVSAMIGGRFHPTGLPSFVFDVALRIGLGTAAPDQVLQIGATQRF